MRKSVKFGRRLSALLLLGVLTCGQAFAMEVPISQEEQMIDGKQTLTQVFEVDPTVDPATLQQESLELNGFQYTLASMTKEVYNTEDKKTVQKEETVALTSSNENAAYKEAVQNMPQTIEYDEEGYKGELQLIASSIQVAETGRSAKSGSSSVTKTYTFAYNDDSLVPGSITEGGKTYSRVSLSWSEGSPGADGAIPESYTATAVYRRGYTYSTVDGYQATATYEGEVSLQDTEMIRYKLVYTGTPIVAEAPNTMLGNVAMWGIVGVLAVALAAAGFMLLKRQKNNGDGDVDAGAPTA